LSFNIKLTSLFLFFFCFKLSLLNNSHINYNLSFSAQSNENINAQIFIDYGDGFNEKDSKKFYIQKSINYQNYDIKLNKFEYKIKKIRFDPNNNSKKFSITINDLKINGKEVYYFNINKHDLNYELKNRQINITKFNDSDDPYITLEHDDFNLISFLINKSLTLILISLLVILFFLNFNLRKILFFNFLLFLNFLIIYLLIVIIFENINLFEIKSKLSIGTNYLAIQAQSLMDFKISLNINPDPILLNLNNPYTQYKEAGADIIYDLSYYKGKYYLYWSIFPAILLALLNILLDYNFLFGDKLFFILILAIYFNSLIFLIYTCLKNKFQTSLVLLIIISSPVITYQLRQLFYPEHGIYQAGYIFSQIFLNILITKLFKNQHNNCDYIIYGLLISLIFFARYSLLPTSICIYIILLFKIFFSNNKNTIQKIILLTLPSLIFGIITLVLNYIKFEDFFNFGQIYQMGSYITRVKDVNYFDFSYYLINLYKYLIYPPYFSFDEFTIYFPDVWKSNTIQFLIKNFANPNDYGLITSCNEPVYGIFWMFPLIFTISIIIYILKQNDLKRENFHKSAGLALLILFVGNIILFSIFFSNTRYFIDFYIFTLLPCLLILKKTKLINTILTLSLIINIIFLNNYVPKYEVTKIHNNTEIHKELFLSIQSKTINCHQ
jgi:hypothetical protein